MYSCFWKRRSKLPHATKVNTVVTGEELSSSSFKRVQGMVVQQQHFRESRDFCRIIITQGIRCLIAWNCLERAPTSVPGTWSDEIVADEGTISRNISVPVYGPSQCAHVINEPSIIRRREAVWGRAKGPFGH